MTEDQSSGRASNVLALEELIASNNHSNTTMVALVEQLKRDTELRDRKIEVLTANGRQMRKMTIALVACMVVLLGIAVFNATNLASQRRNAAATARIAMDTRNTNELLLDCLNSTGNCGKSNADQQRRFLDEVKRYELTGFYCIRTNPALADPKGEQFLKCMNRLYPGGPQLAGR